MVCEETVSLPLELIDPLVSQCRERFDDAGLRDLAENIKAFGQLQPAVVTHDEGRNRYTLICGERRFRALKIAGRSMMAAKVIQGPLTQGQMLAINLAENIQRSSLNAIERGRAFQRLMRLEGLTAAEVAARMAVSNATVSRDISLLSLPETLQGRVITGELPSSVAAAIVRAGDDEARRDLADRYAAGGLARYDIEAEVERTRKRPADAAVPKPLRLKWGGMVLTIGGKQPPTMDGLIAALGKLRDAASELKKSGVADVAALARTLKAS